jgi:hypothetical protein
MLQYMQVQVGQQASSFVNDNDTKFSIAERTALDCVCATAASRVVLGKLEHLKN